MSKKSHIENRFALESWVVISAFEMGQSLKPLEGECSFLTVCEKTCCTLEESGQEKALPQIKERTKYAIVAGFYSIGEEKIWLFMIICNNLCYLTLCKIHG